MYYIKFDLKFRVPGIIQIQIFLGFEYTRNSLDRVRVSFFVFGSGSGLVQKIGF